MKATSTMRCDSIDNLEPTMQSGDCILWQGDGLIAKAIRLFSTHSHASAVIRLQDSPDKVFVVEAVATGLELRALRRRIEGYKGKVFLFQPRFMEEEQRRRFAEFCIDELAQDKRYDWSGLFRNIGGRVSQDMNRYFCSEFYWSALRASGRVQFVSKAPRPGDIPKWVAGELMEITTSPG
jgi:uncharacterized protein YycO